VFIGVWIVGGREGDRSGRTTSGGSRCEL
jgi:hypothetical protein